MFEWFTLYHLFAGQITYSGEFGPAFWVAIGTGVPILLVFLGLVMFAENSAGHASERERCKNAKWALVSFALAPFALFLGNYGGMLLAIIGVLIYLKLIGAAARGAIRSFESCRRAR